MKPDYVVNCIGVIKQVSAAKEPVPSIIVNSLMPAEHDIYGYAKDEEKLLEKIKIVEMLNPYARGFRAVQIVPKE